MPAEAGAVAGLVAARVVAVVAAAVVVVVVVVVGEEAEATATGSSSPGAGRRLWGGTAAGRRGEDGVTQREDGVTWKQASGSPAMAADGAWDRDEDEDDPAVKAWSPAPPTEAPAATSAWLQRHHQRPLQPLRPQAPGTPAETSAAPATEVTCRRGAEWPPLLAETLSRDPGSTSAVPATIVAPLTAPREPSPLPKTAPTLRTTPRPGW